MQTDVLQRPTRRSEELTYVTRNLFGMMVAPILLPVVAWCTVFDSIMHRCGSLLSPVYFGSVSVLALGAMLLIQRWYGRTFGTVMETRTTADGRLPSSLTFVVVSFPLLVLGHKLPFPLLSLGVLSLPPLPRCLLSTPRVPLLTLRKVLGIAILCLWAALMCRVLFYGVSWRIVDPSVFGAFLLLAAYDHWLLLHLLPRPRKEAHHG